MVKRLKISKGDASLNIRELERLGIVKKIWIRGDRKDFYEAELDFYITEVAKALWIRHQDINIRRLIRYAVKNKTVRREK